jgi:hypothetical protein
MKLYSLIKNKRLIKSTTPKSNNINSYLLFGATILAFGGFFYSDLHSNALPSHSVILPSQSIVMKNISKSKQTVLTSKPKLNNQQSKIRSQANLLKTKTTFNVSTIEKEETPTELEDAIARVLIGTPMEKMIKSISKQDKTVAAFLVGIALKESGFGKHVPVLNGQDCYNYWGYRGKRSRMGTGGHTCFDSPEDAVETVGKRLHTLAIKQKRNTPQKMLIWKCGSSCATHSPVGVAKWVSDVSIHFNKINNS